jgi:Tat protein translocase TatC
MSDPSASSPPSSSAGSERDDSLDLDPSRMSFGDHLEELRSRSIKALIGVALATVVSLIFARRLLSVLLQPVLAVLHAYGQRAQVQALGPPDTFVIYLKVGLLCGLILAMPWVLYQIWLFVAAGLYRHEQRFVRRFLPVSVGLFATGVLFLYFIVLPIVLSFFVRFTESLPMPEVTPTTLQKWLIGHPTTESKLTTTQPSMTIPLLPGPPADAPPGSMWIDVHAERLNVQTDRGVLGVPLEGRTPISSRFGLNFYVSFILVLALAFGLAFELPVVVVFLVVARLMTTATLGKSRRYVIFVTFIVAAFLTPPDVLSQILLAIPMIFLFEGGLFVARMIERRQRAEEGST